MTQPKMVKQGALYKDKVRPQEFATVWDKPQIGQVPIQVSDEEHFKCTHYYERSSGDEITVNDVLNILNFPETKSNKSNKKQDFYGCTKLSFVSDIVYKLESRNCSLDLAIVGSSLAIEQMLMNMLQSHRNLAYQSISSIYEPQSPPIHGVLISFTRNLVVTSDINMNVSMKVDYILLYDPSNKDIRQYSHFFQGVQYPKPTVVSLVCLRTADVRIFNYRKHHPSKVNGNTVISKLQPDVFALFYDVTYTEIKPEMKCVLNKDMGDRLVSWMILKDGSQFNYQCSTYNAQARQQQKLQQRQRQQKQPNMMLIGNPSGMKRCASPFNDPATSIQYKKLRESLKPFGIPEDPVLSPETKSKIKARIHSSFPSHKLTNKSLLLDDDTIKGIGWLSSRNICIFEQPPVVKKENTPVNVKKESKPVNVKKENMPVNVKKENTSVNVKKENTSVNVKNKSDSKPSTSHVGAYNNISSTTPSSSSSSSFTFSSDFRASSSSSSKSIVPQNKNNPPPIPFKDKGKGRATEIPPSSYLPPKRDSSDCEMSEFETELEAAHLQLMRSLLGDGYEKQE